VLLLSKGGREKNRLQTKRRRIGGGLLRHSEELLSRRKGIPIFTGEESAGKKGDPCPEKAGV